LAEKSRINLINCAELWKDKDKIMLIISIKCDAEMEMKTQAEINM